MSSGFGPAARLLSRNGASAPRTNARRKSQLQKNAQHEAQQADHDERGKDFAQGAPARSPKASKISGVLSGGERSGPDDWQRRRGLSRMAIIVAQKQLFDHIGKEEQWTPSMAGAIDELEAVQRHGRQVAPMSQFDH
jgi:hypothetical protein